MKRVGKMDNGLSLFSFRYKWQGEDEPKTTGFMSNEVREVAPWAVEVDPSGYDKVRYDQAVEA